MPLHPNTTSLDQGLRSFAGALVLLIEHPAAVVADADELLAQNDRWAGVTRRPLDPSGRLTLRESLRDFAGGDALVGAVRAGLSPTGVMSVACTRDPEPAGERTPLTVTVRWHRIQPGSGGPVYALLVMEEPGSVEHLSSVVSSQRARIDQLLIRQTLIQEGERRRLGRALHDGVAQNLAQLRACLRGDASPPQHAKGTIGLLDRVIDDVRTLTFELSPPILEDLGLLPALHWLAEHLGKRYSANISVADDAREPRLLPETRTIVFRAVRELTVNAAKHAPGAEIVISCVSQRRRVSILVRDTGPGVDTGGLGGAGGGVDHYGLISVEQQIRGIGGTFEFASALGHGTRAFIRVPLLEDDGGHA